MIILLLNWLTLLLAPQTIEPTQNLLIQVVGMESKQGAVQVAIFNSPDKFLERPCHQYAIETIEQDTVQASFNLPPGEYAVAVYHDENENKELDKNFFGIPYEAYGFSNDARGSRLGPPSFNDAKVTIAQKQQTVYIKLR
ncbi:MAG: DUF2141 domain-containing protein [Cyclobacteriaceae bacterium]